MPELRQIRTFVAVAEQLSFTRAGEVLHLKQQSVSKAIRELERELGVELFERTTREVRLTPAGHALLESGITALRAADAAFAQTREVGAGHSGRVRIGFTPAIGPTDQADVARAVRAGSADLSVVLREVRPGELRPLVRAGEIDLALTRVSGADDPALHRAELRPTAMALGVPRAHRLAGRESVEVADIEGERLLTASPEGTPYTDLLLDRLRAEQVTVVPVEARVTGGSTLLTQIADREAVALVPVSTPAPPDVVLVPIDGVSAPLLLLWAAGRPTPAVRRVRDALALS